MEIVAYDGLLNGLKEYNSKLTDNYGNVIVRYPTTDTTYPHTKFIELDNGANPRYNTPYDRVANIGYRVDIFAKTKGTGAKAVDKEIIARAIEKQVDKYLSFVGLTRLSSNPDDSNSVIYHIIMIYTGKLYENRMKII